MDNILIEKHFNKNIKNYKVLFYHCGLCKKWAHTAARRYYGCLSHGLICEPRTDISSSSALSFHSSRSDNGVHHPRLFVSKLCLVSFRVAASHTPCSKTWEPVMFGRQSNRFVCVCILLFHSSLTAVSGTLFTLRSGGAPRGLLAAVFTACWLDAAVGGGVWRETVEWHSVKHLPAQSLNILMMAV